ncbi:MAG: SusC/RagA family TonB-linked outer membrane protein [Chitinophagaceae bacterium]
MKKYILSFCATLFLLSFHIDVNAQQRQITGTVVNADGDGIRSATVTVVETKEATTTNEKGFFSIKAATAQHLEVSSVGYLIKSFVVGKESELNISLQSSNQELGEVVVTALGISREKKTLGYAVQELSADKLNMAKDANIVNSLSGKIAGVQVTSGGSSVGSSARIIIRGNSSFSGNQPLFIIDGTPIDNSTNNNGGDGGVDWGNAASDIDPNNIETLTVLKGANAAALYGSRASNGVIIITTKKGAKGAKKLGVEVNSSAVFNKPAYFPKLQNEYGGGWDGSEYIWKRDHPTLSYQDYAKKYSYNYVDGNGGGVNDNYPINWGPRLNAGLLLDQWSTGPNSPWVSRPNNIEQWFNTGVNYENSVAVTSHGEKASGRVSFTNFDSKGIVDNTNLRQNTISANLNLTPSDRLSVTTNLTYLKKESDNIPQVGYNYADIFAWSERDFDTKHAREIFDEKGNKDYMFVGDNPFYSLRNTNALSRDRFFGSAGITYKLTDWLSANARAGMDFYNEYRNNITQSGTVSNISRGRGGQFGQTQIYNKEINTDFTLNADKTFGKIRVDGLLGANYRNNLYKSQFLGANDLTVPDLYIISNVKGTPSVSMFMSEYETQSLYFAANGSYKDYLFLGITGRNDWSSALPKESWSYFYPSVSLGLSVMDAFSLKSNIFSYAKLRASWAKVGGSTGAYQLDRTYSAGTFNSVSVFSPTSTLPPIGLKPEETKSYEIGADMKFWKNRVSMDVTYYNQTTVNQILSVATSSTTGYRAIRLNAGEIENKGVELMINGKILNNPKGLKWNMTVNWAKNKSMVNSLYGDLKSYRIGGGGSGMTSLGIPGEEWGILWGLPYVRNDKGQIVVDANGIPKTTSTGAKLGSVTPDWTGGINNSFSYKGFNLSVLIDMRMGGDIFSGQIWHSYPTGSYEVTTKNRVREEGIIVDGVFEDGKPNNVRVSAQDYYGGSWIWNNHEYSIMDGSYVKLREVVLGYNFNVNKIQWLSKLNLSIVARNLAILYRDKYVKEFGLDPEQGFGGGENGVGFENFQLPTTRNYGLKLSVSF